MSDQASLSTLLLPARQRLAGQARPPARARCLGRGQRLPDREPGGVAQLQRHFEVLPRGWPMAAITRARDAGDAGGQRWLRADPAHVRPDMTGARVLAIGELGLSAGETEALLQTLRPLFGDAGMQLSAPAPSRWYLALAADAPLPDFPQVEEVLGADLFDHLPEGPEGRRWRSLLNEAQILLHNHPVNQARAGAGTGWPACIPAWPATRPSCCRWRPWPACRYAWTVRPACWTCVSCTNRRPWPRWWKNCCNRAGRSAWTSPTVPPGSWRRAGPGASGADRRPA